MKVLPVLLCVFGLVFIGTLMDGRRSASDAIVRSVNGATQLDQKAIDTAQQMTSHEVLMAKMTNQLYRGESVFIDSRGGASSSSGSTEINSPEARAAQNIALLVVARAIPFLQLPVSPGVTPGKPGDTQRNYRKFEEQAEMYQMLTAQSEAREKKSSVIPLLILAFCVVAGVFKMLPDNEYGL